MEREASPTWRIGNNGTEDSLKTISGDRGIAIQHQSSSECSILNVYGGFTLIDPDHSNDESPIMLLGALLCLWTATAQSVPGRAVQPKFNGRVATVVVPDRERDFFPKGPASVCIEAPPKRQCYTAPQAFGNNPTVAVVMLKKEMPAILFAAASGGVSGWQIHLALLRPGTEE